MSEIKAFGAEGEPKDVMEFFQSAGVDVAKFVQMPPAPPPTPPTLPIRWLWIPSSLYLGSTTLLVFFRSVSDWGPALFVVSLGWAVWTATSLHLHFQNRFATGLVAVALFLVSALAGGFLLVREVVERLQAARNSP